MIPENIIEICVAIDIAILGIAYPIIIDKISNIGDKYSSEYIPVVFNDEFPQKSYKITCGISVFKLTLFVTLFSFIFLIFQFQPPFSWGNWFINNSAKLGVFILTSFLIIFFFVWLGKVALYNGKSKSLLTHLISNYSKSKADTEIQNYHLKAINELAFYAIEKQDEHLQETLLEFYYMVFSNIRKNHDKSKPLVYPIDLYFLASKLNEIAVENKTKLRAIEHRAVSGIWLLGEDFEDITISEETYSWLWRNIYTICDKPRFVKIFWANSSQYFDYRLQSVIADYDFPQNKNLNQEQIDKRNEERNKFLEFHYSLGGLLLYRKQHKTLNYLFEYSQSQPPKYVLLPETMTQIFYWFENFRNEFKHTHPIDLRYYFPELDNLGNRRQVNYWICSYVTILYLRQYSLYQYYITQDYTALPYLPNDVLELSSLLNTVPYFERCLNNVLSNKDLIAELKFEKLIEDNKENFSLFISNLKEAIKDKIGQQKLNAELSNDKINNFYSKSNTIISKAFEVYKPIFVEKDDEHSKSELKLSVNGEIELMSKSAFTDNDIPYLNYDTSFASAIATHNIKRFIPNAFFIARTKRYLLNKDNVILALTKIIGNSNDIIIVGINIGYQLKDILENSYFKNDIRYIPSTEYHSQDTLFVLQKKYLPAIEHNELKEDKKTEFQLQCINEDLKLYASVIDINTNENKTIKDKWNIENESNNEDLKVQLSIAFLSFIYWKNEREIIQVNIASEYREQGIQNDINDVESLSSSKEDNKQKASS
ncbi:hypothetical protein [uncultured Bacteroides sp.]|uniref:hypothetical protein n=1 Tax=uncultured Bacteroides sp. TaxID=162156 RepID=UPI002AAC464D|nr:hypothetical protein [uncultured Bacteroides sp.]